MDGNLIALKLFLDKLGEPTTIDTMDDRVRVQKSVYLGQVSGADLGYRYSWYIKGPYCSPLARDYYALDGALRSGDTDHAKRKLNDSLKQSLAKAKRLLEKPANISLSTTQWYELLAS